MQYFRDNGKNCEKNDHHLAILDIISVKFVVGYPCMIPYILFYIYGPGIWHCF